MLLASIIAPIGEGLLSTWTVDTTFSQWFGYQALTGIGIGLGSAAADRRCADGPSPGRCADRLVHRGVHADSWGRSSRLRRAGDVPEPPHSRPAGSPSRREL